MRFSQFAKITFIGIITLAFAVTPLHAKPKKDKSNNGKSNVQQQAKKPAKKNPSKNTLKKASKPVKTLNPTARNNTIRREKDASQTKALRPNVQRRLDRRIAHSIQKRNQRLLKDLNQSLLKLNNARWSYNPHDDRGQGNMGKVDMLDPYGHDKDSDRMELYGNRGRVIKQMVPEPIPEPDPIPEPEPEPIPEPDPIPEPEPDPIPEPEPEPIPEPEPEPIPEPEPEPDPDPIPEFPF